MTHINEKWHSGIHSLSKMPVKREVFAPSHIKSKAGGKPSDESGTGFGGEQSAIPQVGSIGHT